MWFCPSQATAHRTRHGTRALLRANSNPPPSRPPTSHSTTQPLHHAHHHRLLSEFASSIGHGARSRSIDGVQLKFWFALLLVTLLPFLVTAQPSFGPPNVTFINGGPGQDLSFYGYQSAAVFPLQGTNSTDPAFTLEFWVAPRCSNIKCSFFTLQSQSVSDFAYVHRDSMYCFGQKFVLTDGATTGLSQAPRWDLFADPAPPTPGQLSSRGIDIREYWYHFAFSANATAGTCSVFVNGSLLVTASLLGPLPSHANGSSLYFGQNSRLFLGQLYLRSASSIPALLSFQGSFDEIRLWSIERFPGYGLKTMRRSLLGFERASPSLISYWSMDTEPLLLATSPLTTINDIEGTNIGYLVPVEEINGPYPSPFQSFATFGPSTAPIVTESGALILHINLTSIIKIPLRYACIDPNQGDNLGCPPNLQKKIFTLPGAGKVYSVNDTTGALNPIGSANNTTRQNTLAYEPIEFLLVANNGRDSFRWGTDSGALNGSSWVQIYSPPTTAISTWVSPLGTPSPPISAINTIPIVINLQCGSRLGDSSVAAIISAPTSGQLQQVIVRNTTQSLWSYAPTGQIIPCADPTSPDSSCIVSHPSNSIIFQPTLLDASTALLNLSLTYVCISAPLTGLSASQTIPITWQISADPTQVTFDPTMVGPNPFSLQYDGYWSQMTTTFGSSLTLNAVSLWIEPMKPSKYTYDPSFNISTFSEKRTLFQLYPSNSTLFGLLELNMERNSSSPHLFLTLSQWAPGTNAKTASPVASISTINGAVWIDPEGWTNIIVTLSPGNAQTMVIYIDGSPAAFGTFQLQYAFQPARMTLGHSLVYPFVNSFCGLIDEVTLWSTPFGPFDALARQYVAIDPSNTGLVSYWDFNEGYGVVANDQISNFQLKPATSSPVTMPLWVPATGLPFGDLEMTSTVPKVVTLTTHQTPGYNKWQLGTYVVKLPQYGTLYQYPSNWTAIQALFAKRQQELEDAIRTGQPYHSPLTELGADGHEQTHDEAYNRKRMEEAWLDYEHRFERFEHEEEEEDDHGIFDERRHAIHMKRNGRHHRQPKQPGGGGSGPGSTPNGGLPNTPNGQNGGGGGQNGGNPFGNGGGMEHRDLMSDVRAYLEPITSTFAASTASLPLVYQWVSEVMVVSSSRAAPSNTDWWSGQQLIGPPSWWVPDSSFDSISYGSPAYGENTASWCPAAQCPGGTGNIEFAHIRFDKAVYLRRVEVFQNLNPGAVTRILAWDDASQTWKAIYQARPSAPGVTYSTLIPNFCGSSSFKTNILRIEMDPCQNPGWYEIEAVRISGTETLPPGIVSDPQGRVLYIANAYLPQIDALTYTASECPYALPSASPSFRYQMRIAASSAAPIAQSQKCSVKARDFTAIQLYASSPDPTVTDFKRIINSRLKYGDLYQAVQGPRGLEPGDEIPTDGSDVLVSNDQGYVFYRSPSTCKFNLESFSYFVSSQGQRSSSSVITIDSLCSPSFLNFRLGLLVSMLVITALAVAFATACATITILRRKEKIVADERPGVLVAICVGAIICFVSVFMVLSPITPGWCAANMWILNLGAATVIAGALALTLSKWNDFSTQALRSGKGGADLPSSTIFVVALSMIVEIALLAIFTLINTPHVKTTVSPENSAIMIATCQTKLFSNLFLLVNKAFWLIVIFVINCIFYSVSPTVIRSSIVMLICSILAIAGGTAFVVAINKVSSPSALLILNVLAIVGPISIFLFILFSDKWQRAQTSKQTVETSEFGLQPISPQKQSTRPKAQLQDTVANAQMTIAMNNHSADKSVAGLLDMVQDKEREIAVLKRKLLKKHYRIRDLQQKLSENADSSMQIFSGQDYD